jgi:hypothetical protein
MVEGRRRARRERAALALELTLGAFFANFVALLIDG